MASSDFDDNSLGDISQILTRLTALEGEVALLQKLLEYIGGILTSIAPYLAQVELLGESLKVAIKRIDLLERQMDELQHQNEELLFHQFTARYYSETLYDVKIEYEVEVAKFDQLRSVILDLVAELPKTELRNDMERRIRARPHTVGRRGKRAGRSREVRL